ncbi:MAG: DUF1778 domain-containing protein [gamma proteobacterium symbiont of Taylorina sp.]|nr:DUF1778 domain-containing protein [gamma proteobacterium symbiont of Taylorina sp.]
MPVVAITQNDERINLRLKHTAKLMLERAASFEGQTVSKFVLNSALSRAEKTIQEYEVINLNVKDSETFFNALSAPVKFNRKLVAALNEHEKCVNSK